MALTRSSAVVLTLLVGGTATAADNEATSPPRNRVGLNLGLGSAVGAVGLTYEFAVSRVFWAEAGVGWGWSGGQLSVMPKLALAGSTCAFLSGLGASLALGGPSVEKGHGPAPSSIPWLNFDALGVECPTASGGFSASVTLGLTMPLRAFHWDFAELGDTVRAFSVLPQGRVSVGWRF